MSKKQTPKKAAARTFRRPRSTTRELLDRTRLTCEWLNHESGRVDRHDPSGSSTMLKGEAPAHFSVSLQLEPHPWLWIGLDPVPGTCDPPALAARRTCFAVIDANLLRQVAEDVLRFYPVGRKAGAK